MITYNVKREVTKAECPWLENDVKAGTVVYEYTEYTYGCISPSGIAVSLEPGKTPFFELPSSSLEIDYTHSD